ncbi:MAG TPA: glycosyl transferase [Casimicrobiaceae bacterium]|nr:glycosyl transferase [Casimicrobiaceae bacterium]
MTRKLHVFTSAALNYLPKVRLLCRSVRRHHPDAIIHFVLVDEAPDWLDIRDEPFDELIEASRLGIDDWRRWSFGHGIVELATAVKPFALARLLERDDCARVLYFDPDIVLFSPIDDILRTLDQSSIALTPHQTTPEMTLDAVLDNEVASLKYGIFNLGFIGVTNDDEGRRFAAWWSRRTYDLCSADLATGLFTDQKWLNFAPVFFDRVAIIKSSRHNVATWNLTTRRFTGDLEHGFEVDGQPLGFYHFTGFDSGAHRIMAVKNAIRNEAVQALIGWYERETALSRGDPVVEHPWAFGRYSDGTPIEPWQRRLYRDRTDLRDAFPDPYDASAGDRGYRGWCASEGLRYRTQYQSNARSAASLRGSLGVPVSMRLLWLALSPRAGRPLRARSLTILRNEGMHGIVRRIAPRR